MNERKRKHRCTSRRRDGENQRLWTAMGRGEAGYS